MNDEVFTTLMTIDSFKLQGMDGFQLFFFKRYWDIVGDDVCSLVSNAYTNYYFDQRLAQTLLVQILKEDKPLYFKQFHSINLYNVVYKLITKTLVKKLYPFLDELISHLRSSFIQSRCTIKNVMVAQEVMHHIHKSKSKQGLFAVKINLGKAYDKYSWDFLQATLEDFGFPNKTIQLIMFCVRSFSLSLIWNVTKLSSFVPNKGLQKGDPLFPYHFVLGMKKLSI